jgi:hypothetical protein
MSTASGVAVQVLSLCSKTREVSGLSSLGQEDVQHHGHIANVVDLFGECCQLGFVSLATAS